MSYNPCCVARGAAGVPAAGWSVCRLGRCVCRWAAARPRDRHTRACGSEWSISRPALALPPPTGTAAWPRSPPVPSGPSGALHTGGTWCTDGAARRLEARPGPAAAHGHRSQTLRPLRRSSSRWCLVYSAISHVIPSQLVQTLNSYRWNCNVFVRSQKMTEINYVRNLSGGGPANPCWPCQPAAACTAAGSSGFSGALHTGGAWSAVVVSPNSASRSVQNSPCLASWW